MIRSKLPILSFILVLSIFALTANENSFSIYIVNTGALDDKVKVSYTTKSGEIIHSELLQDGNNLIASFDNLLENTPLIIESKIDQATVQSSIRWIAILNAWRNKKDPQSNAVVIPYFRDFPWGVFKRSPYATTIREKR